MILAIVSVVTTVTEKKNVLSITWVKVFRINPEFRILRPPFHRKLASNPEFSRLFKHLTFLFSSSEVNWSFKLKFFDILWA